MVDAPPWGPRYGYLMSFPLHTSPEPCDTAGCDRPSSTCITFRGGFSLHCAEHGATKGDEVTTLKRTLARKSLPRR